MEIAKVELAALAKALTTKEAEVKEVNELHELELALVGGGCGEVLFG
jgi:hypothetical protein